MYRIFVAHVEDDTKDLLVKLSAASFANEVKEKWSELYEVSFDQLILRTNDLQEVADDTAIRELANSNAAVRSITLVMDEVKVVHLELNNCVRAVKVDFRSPISRIATIGKQIFEVDSRRPIQLKVDDKILDTSSSLLQQGVKLGTTLQIDLGFTVSLVDKSSNDDATIVKCFAGDSLVPTLARNCKADLIWNDKAVKLDGTVGTAFGSHTSIPSEQQTIEIRNPKKVFVLSSDGLQEKQLQAAECVADINPQADRVITMLASALLPRILEMSRLSLKAGSVINTDILNINVKLKDGKLRVLRLPRQACLRDLFDRIVSLEDTPFLSLSCDGVSFENMNLSLENCGITCSSLVKVRTQPFIRVSIRIKGDVRLILTTQPTVTELRYSDLMGFLKSQDRVPKRRDAVFYCDGCGRAITREKEVHQFLPVDCCDLRSLSLSTTPPRKLRSGNFDGGN